MKKPKISVYDAHNNIFFIFLKYFKRISASQSPSFCTISSNVDKTGE